MRGTWDGTRVKAAALAALLLSLTIIWIETGVRLIGAPHQHSQGVADLVAGLIGGAFGLRYARIALNTTEAQARISKRAATAAARRLSLATRPASRDLTEAPKYTSRSVLLLEQAERETHTSGITRATLAHALQSQDTEVWRIIDERDPALSILLREVGDTASTTPVISNPGTDSLIVTATDEVADVLTLAEELAQTYAFAGVEPGHLAAALTLSATRRSDVTSAVLDAYFGSKYADLDDVLLRHGSSSNVVVVPPSTMTASPVNRPSKSRQPSRWIYLVASAILLAGLIPLAIAMPLRVSEARELHGATVAFHDGRFDDAFRRFDTIARKEPQSTIAYQGRACAAAHAGNTEQWAVSEQLALITGMPDLAAGRCETTEVRHRFQVVDSDGVPILGTRWKSPGTVDGAGSLRTVATDEPEQVAQVHAACTDGDAGYAHLASIHALAALNSATSSIDGPRPIVEALKKCIARWPSNDWSDQVRRWISES